MIHTGIDRLADLKGRRIGINQEGSGTRATALLLLADNGIDPSTANLLPIGGEQAASALRAGELDAAFFVISPRAPIVREALAIHGVRLLSIKRAPAYALQHHFLTVLTLPEGAMDLRANQSQEQIITTGGTSGTSEVNFLDPARDLIIGISAATGTCFAVLNENPAAGSIRCSRRP